MLIQYPPDLILAICAHVHSAGLPAPAPTLDPLIPSNLPAAPTALPSSVPPGHWSEALSRRTLASLCLVNRAWYAGAKPWLWRRVEIRLPRSWLSVVDEVAWNLCDDVTNVQQTTKALEASIKVAADVALASGKALQTKEATLKLEEQIMEKLSESDSPIPLELLSPLASRDPSPMRFRAKSKSPTRWKIMQSINDAVRNLLQHEDPGVYIPALPDPRPGRYVRHLDFNHFRTIGMRRSVEEGINSRFVTGARLEAVLKEVINLVAFGATEYMDGALTLPVLKELFLRGEPSRGRHRTSRRRGWSKAAGATDTEEEDRERRQDCKELEAIDFTGCVSAVFVNALTEFVTTLLLSSPNHSDAATSSSEDETLSSRPRRARFARVEQEEPLTFPGLLRLGLRGVKSVTSYTLTPFVLSFPSLTHLDLSCTRATPELLAALGQSETVRLYSLSMGRCPMLTGESIMNFLVHSPVAAGIHELSLYGDLTHSSPLSHQELRDVFDMAPCFVSGALVYLDLSSSPLTKDILLDVCRPQPHLRSLGLSHIPDLGLNAIVEFLRTKAPRVEILTLIATSPELDCGYRPVAHPRGSARQASVALHAQLIGPICTPPFSGVLSSSPRPPPTHVRVVELSTPLLATLGGGAGSWRVVRGKGGRGWYVDTASGWVAEGEGGSVLRRDLGRAHPLRVELDRLADANGNVSSGVGWHARKMEILHGRGMLGREDGLYGAVSFAYQG